MVLLKVAARVCVGAPGVFLVSELIAFARFPKGLGSTQLILEPLLTLPPPLHSAGHTFAFDTPLGDWSVYVTAVDPQSESAPVLVLFWVSCSCVHWHLPMWWPRGDSEGLSSPGPTLGLSYGWCYSKTSKQFFLLNILY